VNVSFWQITLEPLAVSDLSAGPLMKSSKLPRVQPKKSLETNYHAVKKRLPQDLFMEYLWNWVILIRSEISWIP
jgi:hypothetical protein